MITEIHVINEKPVFLKELIHDIGYRLKTNAICTQIKRLKDGFVGIENSIPYVSWNFDALYANMKEIKAMTYEHEKKLNKTLIIGKTVEEQSKILNKKMSDRVIELDYKHLVNQ